MMEKQVASDNDVNERARQMLKVSDEIMQMTGQQKLEVREIVTGIDKISELTQSSASGAEEMAATGKEVCVLPDGGESEGKGFILQSLGGCHGWNLRVIFCFTVRSEAVKFRYYLFGVNSHVTQNRIVSGRRHRSRSHS